ncbi:MAG TPA: GNAT family N-acetyltransferase [Candidatus Baltobacteraceae bacterium]|nr:GNAT family N-acetyltransferase [Candidatus Baltobacteraceae bacterium]
MEVTIRRATALDAGAIAAVHAAAWEGSYRGIMPDEEFRKRPLERRRIQWLEWLENTSHVVLVGCNDGGEILGFAGARMLEAAQWGFDSYLATLYLQPALKRQGLGKMLLRAIAAELRAQGAGTMVLRTLRLSPARRFYEKMGARFIPEGVDVDAGHFDDVVYAFDDLRDLAARL